ncbi:50S ribosomal protein L13 [Candidatus Pacearchaeota archaeon]|nr:50S ribosomal protein L13 [Candidatus Pacearchaeota archaeon]|tara:strand:- start:12223 stop:12636 length:414 start_codon:yes stop_codon:yes gene_type:complete
MVKIIVDGSEGILGRVGSFVAKELLKGKFVDLVNCEKLIVSGKKKVFVDRIKQKRKMGQGSSLKGPIYIRQPDRLVKRIIRGMLPWDRAKGRDAHRRLKCYDGESGFKEDELKAAKKFKHRKPMKYSYMKEIVEALK